MGGDYIKNIARQTGRAHGRALPVERGHAEPLPSAPYALQWRLRSFADVFLMPSIMSWMF